MYNYTSIGAGAYAGCAYCTHKGEYSKALQKMIYPGNRLFLNVDDNLRHDVRNFPVKKKVNKSSPMIKTMDYVDDANAKYLAAENKKEVFQETGCKGPYPLRKLDLHDRIKNTPIDPMHLIKNIVVHVVNLIAGHEDSHKVRAEEKFRRRFPASWITDPYKGILPPAPFSLSKEDKALADERAKRILVPSGFDWHPKVLFSKTTGMKSHEWKQVATHGIIKFCLRGLLGKNQRKTLFQLFDVIRNICAEEIEMDSIDSLEEQVHKVLALLERDFPVSLQVIVFHLLHHLPMFMKQFGPVYSYWMYPYERFNSWVIRRVHNRRYPESTVIETYRLTEWANFVKVSGQLPLCQTSTIDELADIENGKHFEKSTNSVMI